MRRKTLLAISALTLAACADATGPGLQPITELPRALTDAERTVIGASNSFAFSLMRQLNADAPESNLFISPLSVSMALGMTMNGTAGQTLDEIRTTLGFAAIPLADANQSYNSLITLLRGLDSRVDFRIANSIWHEQSFPVEPAFLQTTSDFFDAEVAARDFSDPTTLEAVNAWVNTATAGKIDRILDEIPADAVMYLINAIYFKGDWTTSFDPEHSEPQPFAGIAGSTTVPLMHKSDSVAFTEANGVQAVELPYGRGAFAMTVVLPPHGSDINDFVANMSQASWDALHAAMAPAHVLLWLPKFTLERDYELKEALKGLGIHLAFGGGDFSPLSSTMGDRLEVSEVKHKTFVDVHEKGTEAAAVTSVGIIRVCVCEPTLPLFRADRPFVFAIRERNSGAILFMGKIARM